MGIIAGKKMADVIDLLEREARRLNFFGSVELLESFFHARGVADPLGMGRIQFEPDPSFGFPPSDIVSIERRDDRIVFTLSFMGLVGVTSPLPVYFADFIVQHEAEAGALLDFLTLFNNRMYALFYQAWKKYRLIRMYSHPGDSAPLRRCVSSLAGSDIAAFSSGEHIDRLLAYTGLFAGKTRGGAGLSAVLSDFFGVMPVRIYEFMPRWAPLPEPMLLGHDANNGLGTHTILGTSIYDRSGKFRVVIGPVASAAFESFLPNGKNHTLAKKLIESYCAEPLDYDIEVLLQSEDLITVELGKDNARLGENAAIGDAASAGEEKSMLLEGRAL
jgi:type VI secretion system protein ImpH